MLSVERIYDELVLLVGENDTHVEVARSLFPAELREGDLVEEVDGNYVVNESETAKVKKLNFARLAQLSRKDRLDQ